MEKLSRMNSNLQKFNSEKLETLEDEYSGENVTLLREMREMIDIAITKFTAFEARRKR